MKDKVVIYYTFTHMFTFSEVVQHLDHVLHQISLPNS